MSDDFEFLQMLENAPNEDERTWLITKQLLDSLSEELRQVAYAVAVPHWFDAKIVAVLSPESKRWAGRLYKELQKLSFVEPFENIGHNVHELTRRLILDYLWRERRKNYLELSSSLANYYNRIITNKRRKINLDLSYYLEFVYHLLISEQQTTADIVRDIGWSWHDQFVDYSYSALNALTLVVREHAEAGRLDNHAKLWGRFFEGLVASSRYKNQDAIIAFHDVISSKIDDFRLLADSNFCLGNAQQFRDERDAALESYNEALKLYKEIGDRLGEAITHRRRGHLQLASDQIKDAEISYNSSLSLCHVIEDRLGEAYALRALGDVSFYYSNFKQARKNYREAIELFRQVGDALGDANSVMSLARLNLIETRNLELAESELNYVVNARQKMKDLVSEGEDYLGFVAALINLQMWPEAAIYISKAKFSKSRI